MAEIAMSVLVHEVVEVLKQHKELVDGAENEFRLLREELGIFNAFLADAMAEQKKRYVFKEMERQVRDLVYVVEDIMTDWLNRATAAKDQKVLIQCLAPKFVSLAHEVKSLRELRVIPKASEVRSEMKRLSLDRSTPDSDRQQQLRHEEKTIEMNNILVLKDEEKTITEYIMESKEELDVISIIGTPGLGKTTLARRIFENKLIADEFIRIWIPDVSQGFNVTEIFHRILRECGGEAPSPNSNHQDLTQKVCASLGKKKFLLVLDDVWSVKHWETIKKALPNASGMGGKVLITSCEKKVGRNASRERVPHMLRLLSCTESWQLLQLKVFDDFDSCPPKLEEIGQRIAIQCGGVPLAILMVGEILKDLCMKTKSETALKPQWTDVYENMGLTLQTDEGNHIFNAVGPSYRRLHNDLRDCFLYMGVFPENHKIPASTLIRLWVAEGFIGPSKDRKTPEETAEKHLSNLIDASLLIVGDMKFDQVKTCVVPSTVHAFCRSQALELNLFQVIKESREETPNHYNSDAQNLHRLCLHSDLRKFLSFKPNGSIVRSFLYFCSEPEQPVGVDPKDISAAIHEAFRLLRIFDSKSAKLRQVFLDKVASLTHLRYITLSIDTLEFIPKQVSQLLNLQTLIIETDSPFITMKANLWKMVQLRHLKTKAAIVLDYKRWKGKPSGSGNLQTLSRLSSGSCTPAVLERASNLKRLGICGKFDFPENLEAMIKLAKLKRLTLSATSLDWNHMATLAKFPSLEFLKLKDNAFVGKIWNADGDGFECLQFLLILDTDLESWKASDTHFPSLRYLVLNKCKKLGEIPESVATNLEKLEIDCISTAVVEPARKIEQVKLEAEQNRKTKWGVPFKLEICPGCDNH